MNQPSPNDKELLRLISKLGSAETDRVALLIDIATTTLPIRPLLDHLYLRSHPDLAPSEVSALHTVAVISIINSACHELHESGNILRAGLYDEFREMTRPQIADLMTNAATDAVTVEIERLTPVVRQQDVRAALRTSNLGLGLAVLLLGDGTSMTARCAGWRDLHHLTREQLLDQLELVSTDELVCLANAQLALLRALREEAPMHRLRWMLKRYERGNQRFARIGPGFAPNDLLAEIFGNSVAAMESHISRTNTRLALEYSSGFIIAGGNRAAGQ